MTEATEAGDLLDRLVAAGLATHVFAATESLAAHASLDDEAECVDALGMLADGPLWRVGAFRYGFRAAEGSGAESVMASLRMALPDHRALEGATIKALEQPEPAAIQQGHPGLAVLTAAARGALALPGAQRVVVDAALAEAAIAQALSRIDGAAAAIAERLTPPDPAEDTVGPALARIEAALAAMPAPADHAPDLAAIRTALEATQASSPPDTAEALAGIKGAIDTLADRLSALPVAPDPTGEIGELRLALDAVAVRQEQALAAMAADLSEKLDRQQGAITALTERLSTAPAEDRVGEIAAVVTEIAARPVVNVDFHREREGMIRLSSAMQTILGRLDAAATRLIEGAGLDTGPIEALGERIDALTAALAAEDALATEPADTLRETVEQSLSRLEAIAERLAASSANDDAALSALSARIDSLVAALPAPNPDAPEPAKALRTAFDEGLSRLRQAMSDRDGEARSLVAAAERIGAACAELHGLHSRYLGAEAAVPSAAETRPRAEAKTAPAADPFPDEIDGDLDAFEADRADDDPVSNPNAVRERA